MHNCAYECTIAPYIYYSILTWFFKKKKLIQLEYHYKIKIHLRKLVILKNITEIYIFKNVLIINILDNSIFIY